MRRAEPEREIRSVHPGIHDGRDDSMGGHTDRRAAMLERGRRAGRQAAEQERSKENSARCPAWRIGAKRALGMLARNGSGPQDQAGLARISLHQVDLLVANLDRRGCAASPWK